MTSYVEVSGLSYFLLTSVKVAVIKFGGWKFVKNIIKRFLAQLPRHWQHGLKRHYFHWQIRTGSFHTSEQEFSLLPTMLRAGDWTLDIGANIGHYTAKMSELVGPAGRVIAFEPILDTFQLLVSNASRFSNQNVTLLNVAASDRFSVAHMKIPKFDTGLDNYYRAHLSNESSDSIAVLCIPIDSLCIDQRISVIKIDAEGHDLSVLNGMKFLIQRDHPVMIVEDDSTAVLDFMKTLGYACRKLPGSHNCIFTFNNVDK
jgi:FkbM family methyltransferase